ncbi:hypothetical protein DN069_08220 [Streptacidiphilus pinicola]|uniref:Uncharacterized protein n=2 Tax=Streptacidiphilus pinicola TaxID=2219663 RepID=A0A2X0J7D1_9ACTN|nr:hypothetical protein DN069_08220 [Streptacidiphilus pinicola]
MSTVVVADDAGRTAPVTRGPSVHRRALLTWLAVYPTITGAFLLFGPFTAHLPMAVRTLVMTGLVVPVVVYVLMPALLRAEARLMRRRG